MRILHVNDVAQVGTILVRASAGRDLLFQPTLRRDVGAGPLGTAHLALRRAHDIVHLRKAFRDGEFTHLHVHYATFAHLAELGGLRFTLHLHGGDLLGDMRGAAKGWLVRRAMRRARRVVVSTPDLLLPAREFRPDTEYLANPVERRQRTLPRRSHDWPYVMMLSKMDYLKGWDQQVLLMEELRSVWPRMSFSFIAEGQLPDIERDRLCGRLRALGGTALPLLTRDEFLRRLDDADFAIGQMEVGALGMSELEALSLGVVTVADARAHEAIGVATPVIPPSRARMELRHFWEGGAPAREAYAAKAAEYVRLHHDPSVCLRELETLVALG
jgi:hypothetical protein